MKALEIPERLVSFDGGLSPSYEVWFKDPSYASRGR